MSADDDNDPVILTRKEHRKLVLVMEDYDKRIKIILDEYEHRRWLFAFIGSLSKWIVAVMAAAAALQVLYSNLVKWMVTK